MQRVSGAVTVRKLNLSQVSDSEIVIPPAPKTVSMTFIVLSSLSADLKNTPWSSAYQFLHTAFHTRNVDGTPSLTTTYI